jgi:hypothetical protein
MRFALAVLALLALPAGGGALAAAPPVDAAMFRTWSGEAQLTETAPGAGEPRKLVSVPLMLVVTEDLRVAGGENGVQGDGPGCRLSALAYPPVTKPAAEDAPTPPPATKLEIDAIVVGCRDFAFNRHYGGEDAGSLTLGQDGISVDFVLKARDTKSTVTYQIRGTLKAGR